MCIARLNFTWDVARLKYQSRVSVRLSHLPAGQYIHTHTLRSSDTHIHAWCIHCFIAFASVLTVLSLSQFFQYTAFDQYDTYASFRQHAFECSRTNTFTFHIQHDNTSAFFHCFIPVQFPEHCVSTRTYDIKNEQAVTWAPVFVLVRHFDVIQRNAMKEKIKQILYLALFISSTDSDSGMDHNV